MSSKIKKGDGTLKRTKKRPMRRTRKSSMQRTQKVTSESESLQRTTIPFHDIDSYKQEVVIQYYHKSTTCKHEFGNVTDFLQAALKVMEDLGVETKEDVDRLHEWAFFTWYRRSTLSII